MPWYNPVLYDDTEVALWIHQFKESHGYSPTIREACEQFGWKSPSTGHAAFKRMEKKGLIKMSDKRRREITVALPHD